MMAHAPASIRLRSPDRLCRRGVVGDNHALPIDELSHDDADVLLAQYGKKWEVVTLRHTGRVGAEQDCERQSRRSRCRSRQCWV
jgi:hypothetical protein